jgi:hypothetical protein
MFKIQTGPCTNDFRLMTVAMKINMQFFKSKDTVKSAVGPRLLEVIGLHLFNFAPANNTQVLPKHDKPWWRIRHILVLNLVLIVPFFSQSGVGYDGEEPASFFLEHTGLLFKAL